MIKGAFILSVGLGVGFTLGYAAAVQNMPEMREMATTITNKIKEDMAAEEAAKKKTQADVESTAEETGETPQEENVA